MQNLQKNSTYTCRTQVNTQNHLQKKIEVTSSTSSKIERNYSPSIRPLIAICYIGVPLCIVLIAAISALTAHSIVEGRYIFDLSISRDQIRMRTDVDKRKLSRVREKGWTRGSISSRAKTHAKEFEPD